MQGTKQQAIAENLLLCFNATYVFLVLHLMLFPKRFHPMFPALCPPALAAFKIKKTPQGRYF